jgi:hypothetical protein
MDRPDAFSLARQFRIMVWIGVKPFCHSARSFRLQPPRFILNSLLVVMMLIPQSRKIGCEQQEHNYMIVRFSDWHE